MAPGDLWSKNTFHSSGPARGMAGHIPPPGNVSTRCQRIQEVANGEGEVMGDDRIG